MSLEAGAYRLGPETATLAVHTARSGAAARAGHDLLLHVTDWSGAIQAGATPDALRVELSADPSSLRVREGTGGAKALSEADRQKIHRTIDDRVLKRRAIEFHSTSATPGADGNSIRVEGELSVVGAARPIVFDLTLSDDGRLSAAATVKQSDWGIEPYSAMFGALKVADEVQVVLAGQPARR